MRILLFISIFTLSFNAASQTTITLFADNEEITSILNDQTNSRLGKGVLAWLVKSYDSFDLASLNYYSCDGRFLSSDAINTVYSFEDNLKSRKIELFNEIRNSEIGVSNYAIDILDYDSSEFARKNDLRKIINQVCSNASPEKKDKLVPFFQSSRDKNGEATVWHIFSGSLSRKGDFVAGWAEGHNIFMRDLRKSDGEISKRKDGTPIQIPTLKKDGKILYRYSVNCRENLFAITNFVKYDQFGTVINSSDFRNYNYSSPIPRTFGDSIVNFYCTIY